MGQRDKPLKALKQVEEQGPMLKEIAIVYGYLLPSGSDRRSLRQDPRIDELMRKLGLE